MFRKKLGPNYGLPYKTLFFIYILAVLTILQDLVQQFNVSVFLGINSYF
jgi:hypothetical protein